MGVAKTGTTYLQRNLWLNRQLLRKHGVLYPGGESSAHFFASLDLREARFHHSDDAVDGAWPRLVEETNAWSGSTVISHETFARTPRKTIPVAVQSFDSTDVRVVLTVRDLSRQLPAVWQEQLKNRDYQTYTDFLTSVMDTAPGGVTSPRSYAEDAFWTPHDISALARRWARVVGPESVIVVTVPPSTADRQELWRRFSQAVELPALDYEVDSAKRNESLGSAETELLRRLNERLPEDFEWSTYRRQIKRKLVKETLAAKRSHGGLVVPQQWESRVDEIASSTIDALVRGGYRVVGSLEDLRPAASPADTVMPDNLTDGQLLDVALDVLRDVATSEPAAPKKAPADQPRWRRLPGLRR